MSVVRRNSSFAPFSQLQISTIIILTILGALLPVLGIAAESDKGHWAKYEAERFLRRDNDDPPMLLQAGGPDAFGYFYIDSRDNALNRPNFSWRNITGIGTNIYLEEDDQLRGPFDIGFGFNYYGQEYTQLFVCSNGWIGFGASPPEFLNRPIPTADEPNNILAVYWDDLVPENGIAYFYSHNDSCIVAWHGFGHYSAEGVYTFEVVLTSDGNIRFQYLSLSGTLDSHTIGIENASGTTGLLYTYNVFGNESNRAIYFGLRPPRYVAHDVLPISFESPAAGGAVGDSVGPSVRFFNNGTFLESFNARVTIQHNGEVYNQSTTIGNLGVDSFATVNFPWYQPSEAGSYQIRAVSELIGDQRRINDSIRMTYVAFSNIYTNNFETDSATFIGNNDWEWGDPTNGPLNAHSGVNLWATDLDSNYTVGPLLSSLIADTLLLDTGSVMTFWHWYEIEALFDGGNVKISTDDGTNWSLLTPIDGYDGIISDIFFNPLANEPAFFGASGMWLLETYDLTAYGGQVALIKFDFGSDISADAPGWYVDDLTVLGARPASPGWAGGIVRDLVTSNPLAGAVVRTSRRADTCGTDGRYVLELLPGLSSLAASADYHNLLTADSIDIVVGETTYFDFYLPAPVIQVDTAPIDTTVLEGRIVTLTRRINNIGNGPLTFELRVDYLPRLLSTIPGSTEKSVREIQPNEILEPLDFGDEVFVFDPQTPTGDIGCVGVEFDGRNFWVTGRHNIDDVHKLHKFDRAGNLAASYNQNTVSIWGWRDLAWDGEYLYASDENELAKIDPSTGQKFDTLPMPAIIPPPIRALAYDHISDHFWGANFSSDIVEFSRNGAVVNSYPNDRHAYGLAWDNISPEGPWLWVFSQDSLPMTQVSQFDPRVGAYTGVGFQAIDHNGGEPDLAGGACFTAEWDSTRGVLFCMVMGRTNLSDSHDRVQGYEIAPYSRWLSLTPHSGAIAPAGGVDLNITIDFTDSTFRPDDIYGALLTIVNNGDIQPAISLTVGVRSGIDNDGINPLPAELALHQNYPNPFNSGTLISFDLPQASEIRLDIFDIQGRKVGALTKGMLPAGRHSVIWNAAGFSSGLYFYRLAAGNMSKTGLMTLLK
ncbi:MAG: hypothetical protein A2W25_05980 [candidate division Zixibacteria bacterium RBG_16_53_22]|nr:MAG: hypothetical protein A2W25_05980 [candidate division Zixibacteria bacterium RBG_16_53_22]